METDGRQTHETEHQRRAHAAFEPVEGVGLQLLRDHRESRKGEARQRRGLMRQDILRRPVRFLEDLREHLREDAGVGEGDGEDPGRGRESRDLHEEEGPEELVHGTQEGRRETHQT